MVYFFTSLNEDGKEFYIYIGKDKYENDELLKYSNPKDIWFHVSDLSSAHLYLKGPKIDEISPSVLEDCAQLVKYNSIEGNKQSMVKIVYTPSSNLKKENGYDIGQVSFHSHSSSLLKYTTVQKRDNIIIKRLQNSKKTISTVEFIKDRELELKGARKANKEVLIKEDEQRKQEIKTKSEADKMKSYSSIFGDEADTSSSANERRTNRFDGPIDVKKWEEDFM